MMHWTYDELLDLPAEVYAVLVEEVTREAADAHDPKPSLPDPVPWP
jgi:hypothetical protein